MKQQYSQENIITDNMLYIIPLGWENLNKNFQHLFFTIQQQKYKEKKKNYYLG